MVISLLRADFSVEETYTYIDEHPLDCPISVFGGIDDKDVNYRHLLAWQKHSTCKFRLKMFPGGHFYIHDVKESLINTIIDDLKTVI